MCVLFLAPVSSALNCLSELRLRLHCRCSRGGVGRVRNSTGAFDLLTSLVSFPLVCGITTAVYVIQPSHQPNLRHRNSTPLLPFLVFLKFTYYCMSVAPNVLRRKKQLTHTTHAGSPLRIAHNTLMTDPSSLPFSSRPLPQSSCAFQGARGGGRRR